MGDQVARAEEFQKKAEKKISGWGLRGSKFEDASDFYQKAANSFKLAKSCTLSLSLSTYTHIDIFTHVWLPLIAFVNFTLFFSSIDYQFV